MLLQACTSRSVSDVRHHEWSVILWMQLWRFYPFQSVARLCNIPLFRFEKWAGKVLLRCTSHELQQRMPGRAIRCCELY